MSRRRRTAPAAAAEAAGRRRAGVKSKLAASLLHDLYHAPIPARRSAMRGLEARELQFLLAESLRELGTAYALWHDTPSGFCEDVIGETIWSKQREVLDAVVRHTRTAVPAGFGVGKTWLAGRLVGWGGSVNPPGTIVIVTTATRFRQVRYQLWPHIRTAVAKGNLPGWCDTTQWKQIDRHGNEVVVAYGFTAPPNDEAAMQGVHGTPRLLLVVDEAGGVSRIIGHGTNNLMTGDSRMLAIGNPPTNDPRSWFEELCEEGFDPEEPETTTIRIATTDSPAITGEPTPICRDCQYNPEGHTIAIHLPNRDWLNRTLREYGSQDHPYVIAKVRAEFPKDTGNQVIPTSWVEGACEPEDPTGDGWVRLCDLGLDGETETHAVARGSWVRLGIDVAADGGDEFVIYRAVGDLVEFRYASVGAQNRSQVTLSEKALEEIRAADRLAKALGSPRPVRVKVDMNGLGHGMVGMLERWGEARRHGAEIVGVMVSENPERDDPGAPLRPLRKRDEMWIAMRQLLMPDPSTGAGRVRLRIGHKARVQLSTPELRHQGGMAVVESKASMKSRGVDSPDRAEAACLAIYEPFPITGRRRRGLISG